MKKLEKSIILANAFTGWLKSTLSGRTWSANGCDEWETVQAIRFKNGAPMECHTIKSSQGGWQNGDRCYGLAASSYDDYYKNENFVEPDYAGAIQRHKTDDAQQDSCSYKLYNSTIVESVALRMVKNIELHCALYNPTKHTIITALLASPDNTATLLDETTIEDVIRLLELMPIAEHTENVFTGSQWLQDPVKLYICNETPYPFGVLEVVDTTKRKPVFLIVPPTQTNSQEALAWTFGLTVAEYATMHLQS